MLSVLCLPGPYAQSGESMLLRDGEQFGRDDIQDVKSPISFCGRMRSGVIDRMLAESDCLLEIKWKAKNTDSF